MRAHLELRYFLIAKRKIVTHAPDKSFHCSFVFIFAEVLKDCGGGGQLVGWFFVLVWFGLFFFFWSYSIDQAGLELMEIRLSLPPKCWA